MQKCEINMLVSKFEFLTDAEIEELWEEFEDVLFVEDEESGDSCDLVLASDWKEWNKGTTRDEIWRWINNHHSKGISFLLYGEKKTMMNPFINKMFTKNKMLFDWRCLYGVVKRVFGKIRIKRSCK